MRSLGMVGMADRRALRATSCQEQIEKSTTFSFVSVTTRKRIATPGDQDFSVISTTPSLISTG